MPAFSRLRLLGGYTIGYVGVVSAVLGIYAWLQLKVLEGMPWNLWASIFTVTIYLFGFAVLWLTQAKPATGDEPGGDDSGHLYSALPRLLRQALEHDEYREVIRFGDVLSRPLFESGEFSVRLEVGRITEEAAAHVGASDVQYRTLIDSIGWSLIELGSFGEARDSITHGMELATAAGDAFYEAKANRHLGAIERRLGHNDAAVKYYFAAQESASQITDQDERSAMSAGITYALAHLKFSMRDFAEAQKLVDRAIGEFGSLDDVYRVDMARVLLADIQVAAHEHARARDSYRSVIQSSKANRESVHYCRAVLGLAELYLADGKKSAAKRLLDSLDPDHVADLPAFSGRFNAALRAVSQGA